jgi:hypothetical protein
VLRRRHGLVIHTWHPGPSRSTPQEDGEHLRDAQGRPLPWPSPSESSKGVQAKLEAQSKSSSSSSRAPGAAGSKTDAQVAYGLCFRRSTYGWKDNWIRKSMEVVPHKNPFRINRNCQNKLTSRICHGAASPSFGSFGPCNVSGLLRTRVGVLRCPLGYIISSRRLR